MEFTFITDLQEGESNAVSLFWNTSDPGHEIENQKFLVQMDVWSSVWKETLNIRFLAVEL